MLNVHDKVGALLTAFVTMALSIERNTKKVMWHKGGNFFFFVTKDMRARTLSSIDLLHTKTIRAKKLSRV